MYLFKLRIVFLLSEFLFCNVAIWTKKYAYFVVAVYFSKFRVYRALSLYIKRVSLLVRFTHCTRFISSSEFFIMHWAILPLARQKSLRFQIFIFCTLSRGYYKTYNTLQVRKKKGNNKLHKSSKVKCAQWLPRATNWSRHLHKTTSDV